MSTKVGDTMLIAALLLVTEQTTTSPVEVQLYKLQYISTMGCKALVQKEMREKRSWQEVGRKGGILIIKCVVFRVRETEFKP